MIESLYHARQTPYYRYLCVSILIVWGANKGEAMNYQAGGQLQEHRLMLSSVARDLYSDGRLSEADLSRL